MVDLSTDAGRDCGASARCRPRSTSGSTAGWPTTASGCPTDAVLANGTTGARGPRELPRAGGRRRTGTAIAGRDATFFVRSGWTRHAGRRAGGLGRGPADELRRRRRLPDRRAAGLGAADCGRPGVHPRRRRVPVDREPALGPASCGSGGRRSARSRRCSGSTTGRSTSRTAVRHRPRDPRPLRRDGPRAHPAVPVPLRARRAARPTTARRWSLPVAFRRRASDWARHDAWMLGDALLVAPVLEAGAAGATCSCPTDAAGTTGGPKS